MSKKRLCFEKKRNYEIFVFESFANMTESLNYQCPLQVLLLETGFRNLTDKLDSNLLQKHCTFPINMCFTLLGYEKALGELNS